MPHRRIDAFVAGRDPQVFARNVRRAREGLGWNRQRLCKVAGISPQTLAKVEGGEGCTPGVERKIADAIGTVMGRMWEPQELPHALIRHPESDRWYFAGHADGERYRRAQDLLNPQGSEEEEPIRFDPEAIQDEAERRRMGTAGLASGFVRVMTGHLHAGTIITSLIEVYGRIEADLPDGRLSFFHTLRGGVRFHLGETIYDVREGEVLLAEIVTPAWLEPLESAPGEAVPMISYVDVQARLNPPAPSTPTV